MTGIKNPWLKKSARNKTLTVFLLAVLIGTVIIVPLMIKDKGYFFYYGDFNVQQIPFWQYGAEQVKSGNFGWSWETDLGSDFISSYSFYMLGSPFFWLSLLFPSSWMPRLMGPLLILKMAVAAVGAYLYMRRYIRDTDYAAAAALLYAFSSYTIYNIFFNHFIDVVAVFPFMMLSFDLLMEERRWGIFALATAVNLFTNYFFFVGQAVFLLLYYLLRVTARGDWKFDVKKLLHAGLEAVIGCGTTAVMMLPTYLSVINNPRLQSLFNGWGFYLYSESRRYLGIFHAFLFPPELPHFTYFIEGSETRWQSVAAWLPLVSTALVIAYMANRTSRGTWQKRILACCALAILVPGLGSVFYLLKSTYYSRWLYMMVLVMALVSGMVLEKAQDYDIRLGMRWNLTATLLILVPVAFLPVLSNMKFERLGLFDHSYGGPVMFAVSACICIASVALFYLLYNRLFLEGRIPQFKRWLTASLCGIICIYGLFILISGKASSVSTKVLVDNSIENADSFAVPGEDEKEFYRIDVLDGMDNQGLYWRKPSINFFHSVVSPSIMKFYEYIGVTRNVASRPEASHSGLRALTSVKYVFDKETGSSYKDMYGLSYHTNMYGCNVYRNDNFIPFGFTYDKYVLGFDAEKVAQSKRDVLMVQAIILSDEQAAKYGHMLDYVSSALYDLQYGEAALEKAAGERAASAAYNFRRDNKGFSVEIDLESDNLVFFSLPYEKGWTAEVNGEPAAVEEVNSGLTAVPAKAGHCVIRMDYRTPGLDTGLLISGISLICLAGLFAAGLAIRRWKAARAPAFIPAGTGDPETGAEIFPGEDGGVSVRHEERNNE